MGTILASILIIMGLLYAALSLFPLVHKEWLANEKPLDKAMRKIKGGKA